jgi:hypothetical protein
VTRGTRPCIFPVGLPDSNAKNLKPRESLFFLVKVKWFVKKFKVKIKHILVELDEFEVQDNHVGVVRIHGEVDGHGYVTGKVTGSKDGHLLEKVTFSNDLVCVAEETTDLDIGDVGNITAKGIACLVKYSSVI